MLDTPSPVAIDLHDLSHSFGVLQLIGVSLLAIAFVGYFAWIGRKTDKPVDRIRAAISAFRAGYTQPVLMTDDPVHLVAYYAIVLMDVFTANNPRLLKQTQQQVDDNQREVIVPRAGKPDIKLLVAADVIQVIEVRDAGGHVLKDVQIIGRLSQNRIDKIRAAIDA